jgi:glycosyltransferase involved in cell wall biosynthesis
LYTLACVPAFNEEGVIGKTVKEILKYVDSVVVCDDGSSDNTLTEAKNSGAYVIRHEKNLGKGAGLKSLFDYAMHTTAEVIVTIDGDGQFLPKEIPKLTKDIEDGKSDIVIGYRFETEKDMPSYRKIGNKVLDGLSKKVSNLNLRDTQSGFRAYSKKAIDIINFEHDGFVADSEILIDASTKDLIISEQNVTVLYNTGGRTSTQNPIRHGGSVLISLLEMILMKRPLTYLGIPGILSMIMGFISASYVISTFTQIQYFSIPFSIIAVSFFILGLLLILVAGVLFTFNRQLQRSDS